MGNSLSLLLCTLLLLSACTGGNRQKIVARLPADTSINAGNRSTDLLLDSASLAVRLDKVKDSATAGKINDFYRSRNYQYAWFSGTGLNEQAQAFWNLYQLRVNVRKDSSIYDKPLQARMEQLLGHDTTFSPASVKDIEFSLTLAFFNYTNAAYNGRIDPAQLQWYIPKRKVSPEEMLDSFMTAGRMDWKPMSRYFYQLQEKIGQYARIDDAGGWPAIHWQHGKLIPGTHHPLITQLKKRLLITGDFAGDTTAVFTQELDSAVRKARRSFGLSDKGIADSFLVKQLNIPVEKRLQQMMINADRMRWLPEQAANSILINIPEYKLHIFRDGRKDLDMGIVVGTDVHQTVIFSGLLQYIVFSPYWNVPPSIARKEIAPAIKKDPNYLRRHQMEITGYSGGLPVIRQKPGKNNSLGKVKFLFPNKYNIYLHDTPAKSLFEKDQRAFSHGCIRLSDPFGLARYLLQGDNAWTDSKIRTAMNAGSEKWVTLKSPLPVLIVYLTSWVDQDGTLNFRDDIYSHDGKMEQQLFQ